MIRKKIRYVDIEKMNDILIDCQNKHIIFGEYVDKKKDCLTGRAYIENKMVELRVTTSYKGEIATFITYKDGRDYVNGTNGLNAFMTLNRYWKVPRLSEKELERLDRLGISASPLLDFNSEYEGQRLSDCWCYDLNSAYSAAMLKGWIDASKPPVAKRIDFDEIGFRFNDDGCLEIQKSGYCSFVFKIMKTPEGIVRFIDKYYEMKKNAKTAEEKKKAKQMLNFSVGYLQRVNPWLRAWVVCSCNDFIDGLLDENSLFWNTDSITSKVRRLDLEKNLGAEIGQWKIEHSGDVAYKGNCYQWNLEVPTYRGRPKSWFKEGWDILKDDTPIVGNMFEFNEDKIILEEVDYGKESK
jgi:hypothetical protein